MNILEGWNMYLEIQDLKKMHFNVSQISRRLDLSRTTVYKYLDMTPEEMEQILENRKTRTKKLDKHRELIKSWFDTISGYDQCSGTRLATGKKT